MTITFEVGPGLLTYLFFLTGAVFIMTWHIVGDNP